MSMASCNRTAVVVCSLLLRPIFSEAAGLDALVPSARPKDLADAIAVLWSEFPAAPTAEVSFAITRCGQRRRKTLIPPLLDASAAYQVLACGKLARSTALSYLRSGSGHQRRGSRHLGKQHRYASCQAIGPGEYVCPFQQSCRLGAIWTEIEPVSI
jgi:hypothetical protein